MLVMGQLQARIIAFNPLTAGAKYIRVFIFLLAH